MKPSNPYQLGLPHDTAGYFVFLILLIADALLSGCAARQVKSMDGAAADTLPSPGATVEVGKLTMETSNRFDFNPAVLLNEALTTDLEEEQLLWSGDKTEPRFLFNAKIMDYEPGNAFKRWVLPGWGSTVLEVHGEIRIPDSGAVAAMINNKRSVVAGVHT